MSRPLPEYDGSDSGDGSSCPTRTQHDLMICGFATSEQDSCFRIIRPPIMPKTALSRGIIARTQKVIAQHLFGYGKCNKTKQGASFHCFHSHSAVCELMRQSPGNGLTTSQLLVLTNLVESAALYAWATLLNMVSSARSPADRSKLSKQNWQWLAGVSNHASGL